MGDHKSTTKFNHRKFIFISTFLFCLEVVLILLFFRKIRDLFPIPAIGDNKIVGYSQYFGYPYYFDALVFLAIMLSPIIISFIFAKIKAIKWKK